MTVFGKIALSYFLPALKIVLQPQYKLSWLFIGSNHAM